MAEFEKRLACVIGADGKVIRGYLIVHTYDAAGKPAKRPFYLACFRDN